MVIWFNQFFRNMNKIGKHGRKPINQTQQESIIVQVKIPILRTIASPKTKKNTKKSFMNFKLSDSRINIGPARSLNNDKVRTILKSKLLKDWHGFLRKKGVRGIEHQEGSITLSVICPRCKEIGNPYVKYVERYMSVYEILNHNRYSELDKKIKREKDLVLYYGHSKTKSKLCRICIIHIGSKIKLQKFPESDFDLNDLNPINVIKHIANKDKQYEKFSKLFQVQRF